VGTTLSFFSRFAMFRPMIDANVCKGCKSCEHNCKAACIDVEHRKIDYSRCVDCFNCIDSCKLGGLKYRFAWGKGKTVISTEQSERRNLDDTGRRAFIAGAALAVGTATLKAQEKKVDGGFAAILDKEVPERDIPLTPPGSKSVKDFYRRCTACQLCVAECPNHVLRPSTDLKHFMQPEMSYERGYCRPECTRCSELCPTGAIRKITKEEKTQYHVGTARVNRTLCVVEKGVECGNCARKCPSGAIQMVLDQESGISRPVVNEALCIGCGACENLCPARPISAITVNGRHNHLED
jgi:Pyruvate/2-oxoacid:ferredoxin oxidoreductase delta subunit